MAATVGSLVIDLSANSAAFKKDMGKASAALKTNAAKMNRALGILDKGFAKMGKKLTGLGKSLVSFKGALGVAAGATGLVLLTRNAIKTADAIAKAADAAGITTDALQELRFAGSLVNVEAAAMDAAFAAFGKRLGETRLETGQLTTLLGKLDTGFLKQVKTAKNTTAAFDLIIGRMAGMTDQADRAALAAAAFGRRAGVQMTLLIKDGAGALDEMRQNARDLGLVLDEKLLRSAEKANDQFARMEQILGANLTRLFVGLAPIIIRATQAFIDLAPAIQRAVEALLPAAFVGPDELNRRLLDLNVELEEATRLLDEAAKRNDPFALSLDVSAISDRTAAIRREIAAMERQLELREASATALTNGVRIDVGAPPELLPATRDEKTDPFGGFAKGVEDAAQRSRDLTAELNKQAAAIAEEGRQLTLAVNPLAAHSAEMTRLNELLSRGAITQDTFNRAAAQANERLNEQKRSANLAAGAIEDVMGAAINGQIKSWKDLGRVALGVLQKIIQEQIRSASVASTGGGILSSIFKSIFSSPASSFGTGGGAGSIGGGSSFNLVSDQANFGQFAAGGRPPVNRVSIVGEKGPELFVPGRAGTIVPNKALGGLGRGGGATTIYIDARGSNGDAAVEAAVARGIRAAAPGLIDASVTKVRGDARRDPAMFG